MIWFGRTWQIFRVRIIWLVFRSLHPGNFSYPHRSYRTFFPIGKFASRSFSSKTTIFCQLLQERRFFSTGNHTAKKRPCDNPPSRISVVAIPGPHAADRKPPRPKAGNRHFLLDKSSGGCVWYPIRGKGISQSQGKPQTQNLSKLARSPLDIPYSQE